MRYLIVGFVLLALLVVPVGAITRSADTYRADTDLTNGDITRKQLPLGDLVADSVRTSSKADVAFVQSSVFSDTPITLSRMGFTLSDLLKTLEYQDDTIGVVKLTGVQVRDALENSVYLYPNQNGGLLQTSGVITYFNPYARAGKRVTTVKINGVSLDTGKIYHVAMPMALANGAHGYFKYWKKGDLEKDTGITLETALTNYLNGHKIIAKGEDRLVATTK